LYPDRDWKDNIYHEDHIYPKSEFSESKLKKRDYDEERIRNYRLYYNTIVNLELLTANENLSKNSTPFDAWLSSRDKNFKERHSIPLLDNYSLDNFIDFIDKRKIIITEKLKNIII